MFATHHRSLTVEFIITHIFICSHISALLRVRALSSLSHSTQPLHRAANGAVDRTLPPPTTTRRVDKCHSIHSLRDDGSPATTIEDEGASLPRSTHIVNASRVQTHTHTQNHTHAHTCETCVFSGVLHVCICVLLRGRDGEGQEHFRYIRGTSLSSTYTQTQHEPFCHYAQLASGEAASPRRLYVCVCVCVCTPATPRDSTTVQRPRTTPVLRKRVRYVSAARERAHAKQLVIASWDRPPGAVRRVVCLVVVFKFRITRAPNARLLLVYLCTYAHTHYVHAHKYPISLEV